MTLQEAEMELLKPRMVEVKMKVSIETIDYIKKLLRSDFERHDMTTNTSLEFARDIAKVANELGLSDLSEEMQNDIMTECNYLKSFA